MVQVSEYVFHTIDKILISQICLVGSYALMGSRLVVFFPTLSFYMWLCPFGISGKLSVPKDIGKRKREIFLAMDENSVEKPLLLWRGADSVNKTPLFVSWVTGLKFVI